MRILVVDKEQRKQNVFKRVLGAAPGVVSRHTSPSEALECLKNESFDAAFLDSEMSTAGGSNLAEQILQQEPSMEVIFMTPYGPDATAASSGFQPAESISSREKTVPAMSLRAFGSPEVFCHGQPLRWDRRKTGELFWYLVSLAGSKVHKTQLCEDLWPGLTWERALPNLQVTISRLRKALGCVSREAVMIAFADDCYTLHLGDVDCDVRRFRQLVQEEDALALRHAVDLYKGRFLANEPWLWAEYQRESVRRDLENAAVRLVRLYLEDGDHTQGETVAEQALRHECLSTTLDTLYLEAAARRAGARGLERAYQTLTQLYRQQR